MEVLALLANPSYEVLQVLRSLQEEQEYVVPVRVLTAPRPKQAQRRLKRTEIEHLIVAYESGRSVRELAALYEIHRTTVMKHLKDLGVRTRPNVRKMTDRQVKRALELRHHGWTLRTLGEEFSVDPDTIRKELSKFHNKNTEC